MTEQAMLEGLISVQAALATGNRPIDVIYIRRGKRDRSVASLQETAGAAGVPVEQRDEGEIDRLASGKSHGGVIALVGARRCLSLEQLVAGRSCPFVAMLDGIEDPYNFGQAVRALYAAGVDGLVVRPRNWMSAAGIVARASAGASERIPTAVADTAAAAAGYFRRQGLAVACAVAGRSIPLYELDLTVPLFVLIGGEKRGITRSLQSQAELLIQIPYGRSFGQSLGTAAATAVLAFEILRQRSFKEKGAPR